MNTKSLPNLEERFTKPEGWTTSNFKNPETGHTLHYGYVSPDSPTGCAVILPGLSEFTEIYYETIRDLLNRNIAVIIINWQYQGLSGRHTDHPHKRHSDGFDADISDLHLLLSHHFPFARENLPLIMLGHSTGGNIGLNFLATYPNLFECAAFSAPLIGIYNFGWLPLSVWIALTKLLSAFHNHFVPGGGPWKAENRKSDGTDKFSSDPIRDQIHNAWCLTNPKLQSGNPTLGWLHHALKAMDTLQRPGTFNRIKAPCLFALAGKDTIVDSQASLNLAKQIENCRILFLENSKHEILMETDDIRQQFWDGFDKMLAESNILG